MTVQEVRSMLQQFQDGYSARDRTQVPAFMDLFGPDESLEIVGTGASMRGTNEWCLGRAAAQELVDGDWKGWGDVRLNVDDATISVHGDVAWLAADGTVSMDIPLERGYSGFMRYCEWAAKQEGWDDRRRMMEIVRFGAVSLTNQHEGQHYAWPLRFTAVVLKDADGRWRFRQLNFSHPTTMFPDVRDPEHAL